MMPRLMIACLVVVFAACGHKNEPANSKSPPGAQTADEEVVLTWTPPDGWIAEHPASALRLAQYRLARADGDSEDATAAVFHFEGAGGSVEANLNRWYDQFIQPDGRASAKAAKVKTSEHNGLKQTTVDLSGTFRQTTTPMGPESEEKPNYRMLAGVIETPSGPWFVKITGPGKTVTHWEKSFYEFMRSVRPES